MFPTTRHYIETISNPDELFSTLQGVRPITDFEGHTIFCSGNFGSVFKINTRFGTKALKCFTRHQAGRLSAYQRIAAAITPSEYIVEYTYIDQEIFVFDDSGSGKYYPVVQMEWVDGDTLTKHIDRAVYRNDCERLRQLAEKFEQMSRWLLDQTFAHNDLKPDNIMLRNGSDQMVLIDYDGMFVETMKGEMARELGTEPYQSPHRPTAPFDRHVDNYSIAYIRKALRILAQSPERYSPATLVDFTDSELRKIEADNLVFGSDYQFLGSATSGVRIYKQSEKYGFTLQEGDSLTEASFEQVGEFSQNEGLAPVCVKGKWGFVDRNGKLAIPCRYENCTQFSEGLAAVQKGTKWGYIDTEGREISRFVYDNAWSIRFGRALVRKKDKYGFLGTDGSIAISVKYDFAQNFTEDGLACVMLDGKYGYIKPNGKWWEKPIYDYAQNFRNGRAAVEINEREFFIYIKTKE